MIKSFIASLFAIVSLPSLVLAGQFVELPKVEGVGPAERVTEKGRLSAVEAGLSLGKTLEGKKAQYIADGIARASNHEVIPVDFIDLYQFGEDIIVGFYKNDCLVTIGSIGGQSFLDLYRSYEETVQN